MTIKRAVMWYLSGPSLLGHVYPLTHSGTVALRNGCPLFTPLLLVSTEKAHAVLREVTDSATTEPSDAPSERALTRKVSKSVRVGMNNQRQRDAQRGASGPYTSTGGGGGYGAPHSCY